MVCRLSPATRASWPSDQSRRSRSFRTTHATARQSGSGSVRGPQGSDTGSRPARRLPRCSGAGPDRDLLLCLFRVNPGRCSKTLREGEEKYATNAWNRVRAGGIQAKQPARAACGMAA